MKQSIFKHERNLALIPGVTISTSMPSPVGGGASDPAVLLNERAHRLDGLPLSEFRQDLTFDTFHGRDAPRSLDWYAITFPNPVWFNCIEMTMGLPYRDGGWWTSLNIEVRSKAGEPWQSVQNLRLTPEYHFGDLRSSRRPFQTFLLAFSDVQGCEVRVIGTPGGLAGFTSLARLAVYRRNLSQKTPPDVPPTPVPDVFRLIPPGAIFDLSESIMKVTGLEVSLSFMEYFLDDLRFNRSWARMEPHYLGKPPLWMLLGDHLGWTAYNELIDHSRLVTNHEPHQPYVGMYLNKMMAAAYAPIVVDNLSFGQLSSSYAILADTCELAECQKMAENYGVPWELYQAGMERMPRLCMEQMQGVAELMGIIANSIASLAHRNLTLQNELDQARAAGTRDNTTRSLIQQAVQYMQENLEESIGIASLAQKLGISPAYFSTIFSEQMGCSPIEYLSRLRIERAKEYLCYTDNTVIDVCVALNFSPSYFNRLFKKLVGMTPGEYARQERKLV